MGSFPKSIIIDKKSNSNLKIAIIVSQWNTNITKNLLEETSKTLIKNGVKKSNIYEIKVPGSFELVYAAKKIGKQKKIDAIIVIGCIIKGETPHFEYISNSVSLGIKDLNVIMNKPVIFGVLTTKNIDEAIERSTGKSNKGKEFAISAIQMTKI
tara:strand:- start:3346 stop:3807 length:462 start_codon:yes stop_codon:yes gene_type:complete